MKQLLLFFICLWTINTSSQGILLDDLFNDWEPIPSVHTDKTGDGGITDIDFRVLKMWHSEKYLFLYIETGREINIQSGNSVTFYLDADNRSNTGLQVMGIGAELSYNFGSRGGTTYNNFGPTASIRHVQLGLITAPTVTSDRFEIAINRRFLLNGAEIYLQNEIRVAFRNDVNDGDRLPDTNGGVYYFFDNKAPVELPEYSLNKKDSRHVRFMAYNVERDKLFNPEVRQEYTRIFKALKPDIIGFSEIYDNSSSATAALIETMLPSSNGEKWYSGGVFPDIKLISRYPIVDVRRVDGNGIFLLNMGSWRLICIVAHLPCCENETARQMEIDNLMAFVRSVRLGTSPLDVQQGTPIIIAGDMNFVGFRSQLNTLMTGDIFNYNIYGSDFRPDWDESDMDDALPYVTDAPFTYTWYSPPGTYSAGRLDYIVYTGSVLDMHNSFSMVSEVMSSSVRLSAGLLPNDTGTASDHFPVVMDFTLKGTVGVSDEIIPDKPYRVYPNPTEDYIFYLEFEHNLTHDLSAQLVASDGRVYQKLVLQKDKSVHEISLRNNPSGIYYLVFSQNSRLNSIKIALP